MKHEVWIPSRNISVGHIICGSLPLLPWSLCACLWQGTWGEQQCSATTQEWTRKDAFHLTSVQCKCGGPWRVFYCSASKAWKGISGQSGQGFLFFFPSSSCHLDTNTKLFRLQRNKPDVPGWLFFILSKGWISQHWISSATSSAFMCWFQITDLSSWADLFHKRRKICLFLFEFSFKRTRSRIKSKLWEKIGPFKIFFLVPNIKAVFSLARTTGKAKFHGHCPWCLLVSVTFHH